MVRVSAEQRDLDVDLEGERLLNRESGVIEQLEASLRWRNARSVPSR